MHQAFVLAAGLGTRLRPLTLHRPKPLVPVCGVPMLSYALALCARHGLRDVVVNAHWLSEQIVAWAGEREGVQVHVSVEAPAILGTGGGLRAVRDRLSERFAVVNADVLCDVDLTALIAAVPVGGGAMALRPHPTEAERYGIVAADSRGVVVALTTVASADTEDRVRRDTHFTGIHALHRDALAHVPDGEACVVRTAYKALVPQRQVRGLRHSGLWLDVGDPDAYLDTNLQVVRGGAPLPIDPFTRCAWGRDARGNEYGDPSVIAGVEVHGPCWIGPGARLAPGAVLDHAVIGAGATVPATRLLRAVVWDGVTVTGDLTDAVAHDGGVWAHGRAT